MSVVGNNIWVLSANCQGLQKLDKRRDVLSYFKEINVNILCLQDTHWVDSDIQTVKELWGNDCYKFAWSGNTFNE